MYLNELQNYDQMNYTYLIFFSVYVNIYVQFPSVIALIWIVFAREEYEKRKLDDSTYLAKKNFSKCLKLTLNICKQMNWFWIIKLHINFLFDCAQYT